MLSITRQIRVMQGYLLMVVFTFCLVRVDAAYSQAQASNSKANEFVTRLDKLWGGAYSTYDPYGFTLVPDAEIPLTAPIPRSSLATHIKDFNMYQGQEIAVLNTYMIDQQTEHSEIQILNHIENTWSSHTFPLPTTLVGRRFITGHFNGDGLLDMVVLLGNGVNEQGNQGKLQFLINQTNPSTPSDIKFCLSSGGPQNCGDYPYSLNVGFNGPTDIASVDTDGDGKDDVIAVTDNSNPDVNRISLFYRNGNGFSGPQIVCHTGTSEQCSASNNNDGQPHPAGNTGMTSLVFGDYDGDEFTDIAAADPASSVIRLFKNDGDNSFLPDGELGDGNNPRWIKLANLDNDIEWNLELITANDNGNITIWHRNESGAWQSVSHLVFTGGDIIGEVHVEDLNGDNFKEIIVTSGYQYIPSNDGGVHSGISVLRNLKNLNFGSPRYYWVGEELDAPMSIGLGYIIGGDSRKDVVAASLYCSASTLRSFKNVATQSSNGGGSIAIELEITGDLGTQEPGY